MYFPVCTYDKCYDDIPSVRLNSLANTKRGKKKQQNGEERRHKYANDSSMNCFELE